MRNTLVLQLIKTLPTTLVEFKTMEAAEEYLNGKETETNNAIKIQQKVIAKYLVELADEINGKLKGN